MKKHEAKSNPIVEKMIESFGGMKDKQGKPLKATSLHVFEVPQAILRNASIPAVTVAAKIVEAKAKKEEKR